MQEKRERLKKFFLDIRECRECSLHSTRNKFVFGSGSADAEIMFVGEAPGKNEDLQGLPFVGRAGDILDSLLGSINMTRKDVFIANVLKCRPPGNRDPLPQEVESCRKWLDQQIEIISPKVIVTLGRHSMAKFFRGASIGKIHGTAQRIDGRIYFAMYHPAAALHQQSLRKTIEADILKLPEILAEASDASPDEKTEPEPKQLSMF